jgi:hypothetical protein
MFSRRRISREGLLAEALVVSVKDRAKWSRIQQQDRNNELRAYEYGIEVRVPGGAPFAARIRRRFWTGDLRPQIGEILHVRYDAGSRETVFVLEGDPRYDIEALRAERAAAGARMQQSVLHGAWPPEGAATSPR